MSQVLRFSFASHNSQAAAQFEGHHKTRGAHPISVVGPGTLKDHRKIVDADEFRIASMKHKKHLVMSQKAIARSRKLIEYTKQRIEKFKKAREPKRLQGLDLAA